MASTKLKVSLGLLNGYCSICYLVGAVVECLIETVFVLACLPFTPILCLIAACEREEAEPEELDKLVQKL